jgi:hypothetical protein
VFQILEGDTTEVTTSPRKPTLTPMDRVMRRTNTKVEPGCCWECSLAKSSGHGYPHAGVKINGKTRSLPVHQIVWMAKEGVTSIPKGKMVTHTCDNKKCCNPDHLVLGDSKTNGRDAVTNGKHRTKFLTEGKARAIFRARHQWGWSLGRICAKWGVSPPTVRDIASQRTWRETTNPLVHLVK